MSGLPEVPERYELHFVDYNAASICMRDDGEYVLHEDYADLRAAAEKLQEALTQSRVLEEQTFRNNADLRAENEALRKDAERYRWLRNRMPMLHLPSVHIRVYDGYHFHVGGYSLDKHMDAAMQASAAEGKE